MRKRFFRSLLDTRNMSEKIKPFSIYPVLQILIFVHSESRVPDLVSRIPDPKTATREGREKIISSTFFVDTNITKLKIILFWTGEEKNLGRFTKNYRTFYPKNCHQALKNIGSGSGIQTPGSQRHRILVHGSGSATLNWSDIAGCPPPPHFDEFFDIAWCFHSRAGTPSPCCRSWTLRRKEVMPGARHLRISAFQPGRRALQIFSRAGLGFWWHKYVDIGLNKRRTWF